MAHSLPVFLIIYIPANCYSIPRPAILTWSRRTLLYLRIASLTLTRQAASFHDSLFFSHHIASFVLLTSCICSQVVIEFFSAWIIIPLTCILPSSLLRVQSCFNRFVPVQLQVEAGCCSLVMGSCDPDHPSRVPPPKNSPAHLVLLPNAGQHVCTLSFLSH